MLTGKLPYGAQAAKAWTRAAQKRLQYAPVAGENPAVPAWVDEALKKAVHPDPFKRYAELSEFVFDLRHPNQEFLHKTRPPLIERNPLLFWKSICFLLAALVVFLLTHR